MSDHEKLYRDGVIATTSGLPPKQLDAPAPDPDVKTEGAGIGQHKDYWILSAAERAKGFVRPVRQSYRHVGILGPTFPLRDLTDEERESSERYGYVKFEAYPESEAPLTGRYWTQKQLDSIGKGCGSVTTMSRDIAETYACNPQFYGSTFCVHCRTHLRVGADGEFVWEGTTERVGT